MKALIVVIVFLLGGFCGMVENSQTADAPENIGSQIECVHTPAKPTKVELPKRSRKQGLCDDDKQKDRFYAKPLFVLVVQRSQAREMRERKDEVMNNHTHAAQGVPAGFITPGSIGCPESHGKKERISRPKKNCDFFRWVGEILADPQPDKLNLWDVWNLFPETSKRPLGCSRE
jgi:hypothetical protein